MSEFFRSAARCDISVVRKSPIPINEKQLIEEEIASRQWDTLADKIAIERDLRQQVKNAELEETRQREQNERMRRLRLEEKRKEAINQKEVERGAKLEMEKSRHEDMEMQRLAAIEEKRQQMQQERDAARAKAAEVAYEEVQNRLRKALKPQTSADTVVPDESNMNYMERLRIEKERLGRMGHLYSGGIGVFYTETQPPKSTLRSQLERDVLASREAERLRLERERQEIENEERAAYERELAAKQNQVTDAIQTREEWLRVRLEEDHRLHQVKLQKAAEENQQKNKKHDIEVMHEAVRREFMREQEAEALVEENLREGVSHLGRLEQYLDAEREAWREQRQLDDEMSMEQDGSEYPYD